MSEDIGHILGNWKYDPESDIIVRLIDGDGGTGKLQMRIDMGIVQIELDGNPAGEDVRGFKSWLDFYENKRKRAEGVAGSEFSLGPEDCRRLRREGVQYYYRYVGLMKLGDFERVTRDTARNLKLFAFAKKYAAHDVDSWALDQYRPYVIMMYSKAMTALVLEREPENGIEKALEILKEGIDGIVAFYHEYDIMSEMDKSIEFTLLNALRTEYRKTVPESLEDQLKKAVEEERFEDAAKIRDMMKSQDKQI